MRYIYKWNGNYFGFVSGENLFDKQSNWIGWLENNQVWLANGYFLGEIYNDDYILKNTAMVPLVPKVPHVPPVPPVSPVPSVNRVGMVPVVGWEDPLDNL